MEAMALAVVIIIIAIVAVRALKRRPKQRIPNSQAQPSTLRQPGDLQGMQPGDWIEIAGYLGKFQVVGFAAYQEHSTLWKEFMLVSDLDGTELYLGVESEVGALNLTLWHPTTCNAAPGERRISHEGRSWELEERGTATYVSIGKTRLGRSGDVQYVDYRLEDGTLQLSFERFDGDQGAWEVSTGETVNVTDVTLYPGS